MKKLRFTEWDESKHPRAGGKFAPKSGAPSTEKSIAGLGSIKTDAQGTHIKVGWLARAALEYGIDKGIHAAGTALIGSGAVETATGAGAVVGIPSIIGGLALHGVAKLIGHTITQKVTEKIENSGAHPEAKKAMHATFKRIKHHAREHLKRVSVEHPEHPLGHTKITIAPKRI